MMVRKMKNIGKTMGAGRILAAAVCMALCMLTAGISAAGSETAATLTKQLEPDKKGSISLNILNPETQAGISGISLELIKVAELAGPDEEGNYSYALTGKFADSKVDVTNLTEKNVGEREKAEALQTIVNNNNIRGTAKVTDNNGSVSFTGLDLGVYLIQNYPVDKDKETVRAFLVTVPRLLNNTYVYDVNATGKPEAPDIGGGGDETESESNGNKKKKSSTEKSKKKSSTPDSPGGGGSTGSRLPQTGQLWWPVPVLIAAGLVLIVFGLIRRRKGLRR